MNELVVLLDDTRKASRVFLKGIDPDMVVYKESGWRTRDIIGHLTDWDIVAVQGLNAYMQGEVYLIPDYSGFDAFNHPKAQARWTQPVDAIFAEWEANHMALKDAVRALPADKLGEIIRLPWHEDGSLRVMIRIMAGHEHEHVEDIVRAAREAK